MPVRPFFCRLFPFSLSDRSPSPLLLRPFLASGLRATDDNPVVATSRDFTLTNDAPGVGVTPAPTLAADVPSGPMPGNIRKARHFLGTLLRLLEYLKVHTRHMDMLLALWLFSFLFWPCAVLS